MLGCSAAAGAVGVAGGCVGAGWPGFVRAGFVFPIDKHTRMRIMSVMATQAPTPKSATLYFTKLITSGTLNGMRVNESMTFYGADAYAQAERFIRKAERGIKGGGWTGPSWRMVDRSFQNYDRSNR